MAGRRLGSAFSAAFRRARVATACLVSLACVAACAPGGAARPSGSAEGAPRAETPKPLDVRVMSFNIRYGTARDGENVWAKRRELVFRTVRDYAPEVVGLQEALRFQIDEIRRAVPGYAEVGTGREGGTKGEYSAILFRAERFDVTESGTFWLSDTPEVPSRHWGNACIRICTWARLVEKRAEKRTEEPGGTSRASQAGPERSGPGT